MRRIFVLLCLICCVFSPSTIAQTEENYSWEIDLDNGYISTKPIFLEEQDVIINSGVTQIHLLRLDLSMNDCNYF